MNYDLAISLAKKKRDYAVDHARKTAYDTMIEFFTDMKRIEDADALAREKWETDLMAEFTDPNL